MQIYRRFPIDMSKVPIRTDIYIYILCLYTYIIQTTRKIFDIILALSLLTTCVAGIWPDEPSSALALFLILSSAVDYYNSCHFKFDCIIGFFRFHFKFYTDTICLILLYFAVHTYRYNHISFSHISIIAIVSAK